MNVRKLTDSDALLIRASPESVRALARMLGVSHHTVWRARTGRTYKLLNCNVDSVTANESGAIDSAAGRFRDPGQLGASCSAPDHGTGPKIHTGGT
jgi:hypothetical protein